MATNPSGSTNNNKNKVPEEDWRNLLESSRAINLGQDASFQINRSLAGIEAEAQRLSSGRTKRMQGVHVSNTELKDFALKGAGVDIQIQKQYIDRIASVSGKEQQEEAEREDIAMREKAVRMMRRRKRGGMNVMMNTMDLDNFLRDHHEYVVSSSIQKCQQLSSIKFRKKYDISMHEEWDNTKLDILNFLQYTADDNDDDDEQDALDLSANDGIANISLLDYPKFISQQKQHQQMQ